jgi:aspartate-semialdehyde dehydrogenase
MIRVLRRRNFPAAEVRVFARFARRIDVDGEPFEVQEVCEDVFRGVDIALFAGGDRAEGHFGWPAVEAGAVVIDNGSAYRLDPRVPLVVPEVNPDDLRRHSGFVANPNCSTIQMVHALKPLHDAAGLRRVVVSTYQAVSGRGASPEGSEPVETLYRELKDLVGRIDAALGNPHPALAVEDRMQAILRAVEQAGDDLVADPTLFPHAIAGNCLPQVDAFLEDGYSKEEVKMVHETRKILGLPDLPITATTVRVPVFNAHSESVNVELERPLSPEQARARLAAFPGIAVLDDPPAQVYPLAISASGRDEVFVGRIRRDPTVPHGLNLWVVSDNLRKGAALNAVQIAEKMVEMRLL